MRPTEPVADDGTRRYSSTLWMPIDALDPVLADRPGLAQPREMEDI